MPAKNKTLGEPMIRDSHIQKPGNDPVVEEYKEQATIYDQKWQFYIQSTTRETLTRLPVVSGAKLLDVGCGTGHLLEAISRRQPQVTLVGLDPVCEMLEVARQRVPQVALYEGWAEAIPFQEGEFDWVVCCNVFHFIRKPGHALTEMRRVLRPGGGLLITDWCDDYLACRLCDWYLRLFDSAHYKTYRLDECFQAVELAGYQDIKGERYKISRIWGMMTVSARRPRKEN